MTAKFLIAALVTPALTFAVSSANYKGYHDYLLNSGAVALSVADVNNDGIPDVLAGTGAGIAVLLGKADGTLSPPVIAGGTPIFVTSMTAGDFNNDGKLDIVTVNIANGSYLTIALGNGDGTFQAPVRLPINCVNYTCSVTSADFNGDGKPDLAVAFSGGAGWVTVYLGNGDGTFHGGQPSYGFNDAVSLASADLNLDGKPDLVVADEGANTLSVLLGNGDGSFSQTKYGHTKTPYAVLLADFNGDGLPDVATGDSLSGVITIWLNQGGGVLGQASNIYSGCNLCNLQSLAAGDFNHDGKLDIATPASILHGNGDGTFQPPVSFVSVSVPSVVAAATHSGESILVVGGISTTDLAVLFGNHLSVSQPPTMPVGYSPWSMVSSDFNGDGKPDLAVVVNGSNQVRVLLGDGHGGFTQSTTLSVQYAGAVVTGDFNLDGKMDLAVAGEGTFIFLGNGDGTFTAGAQYSGVYGSCSVNLYPAQTCFTVADFNGDGIPDIAGALYDQDQLMFLFGNGDGTFRSGPVIVVSDAPQGLAAGDFNHDGKMDLAFSGYLGTVQVLPGKGDGTFGNPVVIQFHAGGLAGLAVGDINGDGFPDIVVAGGGGGSLVSLEVYVITGNGDLTFNAPFPLIADAWPSSVLLVDVNLDGKPDIVCTNTFGQDVAVLVNKGNLNFAPAVLYGTASGPVAVVSGDFNGDGLPDLVALDQGSGDLTLLLHAKR